MLIEATLLVLFAGAPLAAWAGRFVGRRVAYAAALTSMVLATAWLVQGPGATLHIPWAPLAGLDASFVADGTGHGMLLLVLAVGAAVQLYASAYLEEQHGRAMGLLMFFEGAMAALVLAGDLFTMFAAWELTSIASFLLIGWKNHDAAARKAAQVALAITGLGGAAFLGGAVALHAATGTAAWADIGTPTGPLADLGLGLMLLAALTKSAQVPFHSWLPGAMKAPAFVSAYLHSATLVKAGVFLIARLHGPFSTHPGWQALVVIGAVTLVWGAAFAFIQTDMKAMLASTTVATLGVLVMLMGIGTTKAFQAAWLLLFVHALYKAGLFLAAGCVEHGTGTRDLTALRGIRRAMPWTTAGVLLGVAGLIGLPPFVAFVGKETWFAAAAPHPFAFTASVAAVSIIVAAALAIARAIAPAGPKDSHAHEVPPAMWAPPLLLGIVGLGMGIDLRVPEAWLLDVAGGTPGLAIWHGLGAAFLGTLSTYVLGAMLLPARHVAVRLTLTPGVELLGRALYAGQRFGAGLGVWLQRPGLATQAAWIAAVPAVLILGVVRAPRVEDWTILGPIELIVLSLLVASAIGCAVAKTRIQAVLMLGFSGFATALLFILVGAPDLAMTQFLYETLAVLLILAVLARVPASPTIRDKRPAGTAMRVGVSVLFGAAFALPLLLLADGPPALDVGGALLDASQPEGKGRNAVNVILVDFRALDTLGEVVVLGAAAIAAFAIGRRP